MAKIYLWQPKLGVGVGHLSLLLADNTYISHWPKESRKTKTVLPRLTGALDSTGKRKSFEEDVRIIGRKPDGSLKIPDNLISCQHLKFGGMKTAHVTNSKPIAVQMWFCLLCAKEEISCSTTFSTKQITFRNR